MGSVISAGYYSDQASKTKKEKCPKGGEHKWEVHFPNSPSRWEECKKCGECVYYKQRIRGKPLKRHLHFLEPGYRTEEYGCTCLPDTNEYEYSLGFTDCWQVFMFWRLHFKNKKVEYDSPFWHEAVEAKEKCPLHSKEMLVEDIPEDYPWTPSEYIDLR